MELVNSHNDLDSHQKQIYEIKMMSHESNPRRDIILSTVKPLVINQTNDLNHIEPDPVKVQRKRKRIIIDEDEDEDDTETNHGIIKQLQNNPDLVRLFRKIKGPIDYQSDTESNSESVDSRGNLKSLIDYDQDHDPSLGCPYDSDEDPDYKEKPNIYDREYLQYIKNLPIEDQTLLQSLEQELKEFSKNSDHPLKYRILMLRAPVKVKVLAMDKLKALSHLEKSSPDYGYEWSTLNHLLNLPWETYIDLPVKKSEPREVIQNYLSEATKFLDTITFGQFKAKSTLLLELGTYLENPDANGFILGVKGPPGSGKTTLMGQGLAKLLHRPFFRIDLGGAKHSDSLFGSRKVFERSDLGDLTKFLIEGRCLNPIFFFDELDKISSTEYGMEIIHGLNDLTDRARNNAILDQYLGVHLDYSRAVFVFGYNSSEFIPETLRSRIHEIEIEPYTIQDKIQMTRKFFLPKACGLLNFNLDQIYLDDNAIKWLIKNCTQDEEGARHLEDNIKKIVQKINWLRLTQGHSILNNYHGTNIPNLNFPLKVNTKLIKQLIN